VTPEQAAARLAAVARLVSEPTTVEIPCDRAGHGRNAPTVARLVVAPGAVSWRPKVRRVRLDAVAENPHLMKWNETKPVFDVATAITTGVTLVGQCRRHGRVPVALERVVRRAETTVHHTPRRQKCSLSPPKGEPSPCHCPRRSWPPTEWR
jgi:hypothetical protein